MNQIELTKGIDPSHEDLARLEHLERVIPCQLGYYWRRLYDLTTELEIEQGLVTELAGGQERGGVIHGRVLIGGGEQGEQKGRERQKAEEGNGARGRGSEDGQERKKEREKVGRQSLERLGSESSEHMVSTSYVMECSILLGRLARAAWARVQIKDSEGTYRST
jgi:hypothetical protein